MAITKKFIGEPGKPIIRSPRYWAGYLPGKEEEHLEAVAVVLKAIPRINAARHLHDRERIALGHKLIALKNTCEHGEWKKTYKHYFHNQKNISFDRAQEYMRKAREALMRKAREALEKADKKGARLLSAGADQRGGTEGKEIREANENPKAVKESRAAEKKYLDSTFKHLTSKVVTHGADAEWTERTKDLRSALQDLYRKFTVEYPAEHKVIDISAGQPR